jgi:hypothetical protein
MKFSEIDLRSIGNGVHLAGGIWAGEGRAYLLYFPEYGREFEPVAVEMDGEDWKALLRQSDLVETEVLAKAEDGTTVKAIVRKCQRTIDQQVGWNVFRRDGFRCRYCGTGDRPLTVDHLVLWEEGGPSTEANLLSSCRKCNKTRGRLGYAEWLRHPRYLDLSRALDEATRGANERLVETLAAIPRMLHVRSR